MLFARGHARAVALRNGDAEMCCEAFVAVDLLVARATQRAVTLGAVHGSRGLLAVGAH